MMNKLAHKLHNLALRKQRVRATIAGTAERPRLTVHISNRHVSAQLVNDDEHATLAYVSTIGKKAASGSLTERAAWVGAEIAKKAQSAKIKTIVFDRNGRLYHGRVKALADAARKTGLEF